MRKTVKRLNLKSNTVRALSNLDLAVIAGAARNTLNGTGPNCASDAGGCQSGNWSCAGVSCC